MPLDRVNRKFRVPAPNMLWASDLTYGSTWSGFIYIAFAIDAFARRIVGWRVSRSAHAGFVLDALKQALHERRLVGGKLIRHSDKGAICFDGAFEFATLTWVGWFNNRRLLKPIGNIPPAEAEASHHTMLDDMSAAT